MPEPPTHAFRLGTDLVAVARIADLASRHADRFRERVFTRAELAYADANPKRTDEHLAARFAAKEAARKALGTGLTRGSHWTDIEGTRHASGQPELVLHNRAHAVADELGITGTALSLSHTAEYASATVIAW